MRVKVYAADTFDYIAEKFQSKSSGGLVIVVQALSQSGINVDDSASAAKLAWHVDFIDAFELIIDEPFNQFIR